MASLLCTRKFCKQIYVFISLKYLNKYYSQRAYKEPIIDLKGTQCPDLIIVIPCYNEPFSNVKQCIESLINQEEDPVQTLVLLLINYKSSDSEEIKMASQSLKNSIDQYVVKLNQTFIRFHTFLEAFSGKTAGVGKARKILMDMAFNLFYENDKNGIIVNLDADTLVHKNYLYKINRFFKNS